MNEKIQAIAVDLLEIRDQHHRTKDDLSGLIQSLKDTGQINPIIARKEGARFVVVAGRRRTSAWKAIQAMTGEKQKALVIVTEKGKLLQELITIDENIHRKQLGETELDEALFRRKEIYEELHPETKANVAGGLARHTGKSTPSFTKDAASKLGVSKRTVETAIARAAKASPAVKRAREQGLNKSKVDMLVALEPAEQDIVLPLVKERGLKETKSLIDQAKQMGARAAVRYLKEEEGEVADREELKKLVGKARDLLGDVGDALSNRMTFEAKTKFESIRVLEALTAKLEKFTDYQRVAAGSTRAIRRRGSEETRIRR